MNLTSKSYSRAIQVAVHGPANCPVKQCKMLKKLLEIKKIDLKKSQMLLEI